MLELGGAGGLHPDRHELEETASRCSVSRSAIIREALENYLFRLRFRQQREELLREAVLKNNREFTDEDVFEIVS